MVRLTPPPSDDGPPDVGGLPPLGFLAALQFLTRVPVRLRAAPRLDRAVVWFPAVGVVVGAAVGGVAAVMWHVVPPLVAGAVGVVVGLLLTGAFHEDGLGDVADAFGGGVTRERRLEILDDSRHGTYGVTAICASVVVRMIALGSVTSPTAMLAVAVAAHTLARSGAVVAMATMPMADRRGLGSEYGRSTSRAIGAIALVAGMGASAVVVGWWVAPLAVAALIAVGCTGGLAKRKIGGISGDVLGAAEQVAECITLVVACGLAAHHHLWWAN